jgi:hypothetical protein
LETHSLPLFPTDRHYMEPIEARQRFKLKKTSCRQ